MGNNYYRISKRDVDFVLNEQLQVGQLCELEKFKDFSPEDFDMVLTEAIKFAQEVLGPMNQDADRDGAHFEKGDVKAPPYFHKAYKLACENDSPAVVVDFPRERFRFRGRTAGSFYELPDHLVKGVHFIIEKDDFGWLLNQNILVLFRVFERLNGHIMKNYQKRFTIANHSPLAEILNDVYIF